MRQEINPSRLNTSYIYKEVILQKGHDLDWNYVTVAAGKEVIRLTHPE